MEKWQLETLFLEPERPVATALACLGRRLGTFRFDQACDWHSAVTGLRETLGRNRYPQCDAHPVASLILEALRFHGAATIPACWIHFDFGQGGCISHRELLWMLSLVGEHLRLAPNRWVRIGAGVGGADSWVAF